jgi:hypothetical protein
VACDGASRTASSSPVQRIPHSRYALTAHAVARRIGPELAPSGPETAPRTGISGYFLVVRNPPFAGLFHIGTYPGADHNPRVGGSSPSSGIVERAANTAFWIPPMSAWGNGPEIEYCDVVSSRAGRPQSPRGEGGRRSWSGGAPSLPALALRRAEVRRRLARAALSALVRRSARTVGQGSCTNAVPERPQSQARGIWKPQLVCPERTIWVM